MITIGEQTHADRGGATWPLRMAYVGVIGLIAASNLLLLQRMARNRRRIA
jgi:preprotein translocase subunit SecY